MKEMPIVIISGSPGSGKSSVARQLAEHSVYERAVHMHTDDFYQYIYKGYVEPWLPQSQSQNVTVIEALVASATRYAAGGYEVIVDGVVGPWFLDPWLKVVQGGFAVHYVVLRPDKQTTIERAGGRQAGALVDPEVVGNMWQQFAHLGAYEAHAIDTTTHTINESVIQVRKYLTDGTMRLS